MRGTTLAVAVWLLVLVASAFAQQQAALQFAKSYVNHPNEAPFMLQSEVAEVGLQLAVTERNGRAVTGLGRDDLQVLENGRPAEITELREDDLPLRIALVLDWSNSMQEDFGFERKVALDFLHTVLRPDRDRAMVVGFRYRVEVTQSFTGDVHDLEAGLRPIAGVSLSSVYDALITAADELGKAGPLNYRRAIVLLSDGDDNVSAHGLSDVIQAAQRANITIYTISPRRVRWTSASKQVLKPVTEATGGRRFFVSQFGEQPAFAAISQDLRLGYTLYFKPGATGGHGFRSLEVKTKDRNLQVLTRNGYYVGGD
jgi:Ca-activated chloride channel family protein